MTDLHKFLKDTIEKHRKTFDENNIRDYTDAFLLQQKNIDGSDDYEALLFQDNQLVVWQYS